MLHEMCFFSWLDFSLSRLIHEQSMYLLFQQCQPVLWNIYICTSICIAASRLLSYFYANISSRLVGTSLKYRIEGKWVFNAVKLSYGCYTQLRLALVVMDVEVVQLLHFSSASVLCMLYFVACVLNINFFFKVCYPPSSLLSSSY